MDSLVFIIILGSVAFIYYFNKSVESINSSIYSLRNELSGKLDAIANALIDQEEVKKLTDSERKELKRRFIKLLVAEGKTEKQAKQEADKNFEEAEFEETHDDFPMMFDRINKWVIAQEVENRNKSKYGNLLTKFREYLRGKTTIRAYGSVEIMKALNADYKGENWLIEKMLQEKRLKKVEEYKDGLNHLKYYEVINPDDT